MLTNLTVLNSTALNVKDIVLGLVACTLNTLSLAYIASHYVWVQTSYFQTVLHKSKCAADSP